MLSERYLHQITLWLFGILPNVSCIKQNRDVSSALSAHFRTGRLRNNQIKSRKKVVTRQLGCVSLDVEPPESSSILRKTPKVLGPIRRARFTRTALIKQKSVNEIQVKLPHQRSPHAVKFEDRSQEKTKRQERCARGDGGDLPRISFSSKKRNKLHSFRKWSLPAASTIKPKERKFVVDSGASMQMVSRKVTLPNWKPTGPQKKSDDSGNSQRRGANKSRGQQCMSENWIYSWQQCFLKTHQQFSLGKLCEDHGQLPLDQSSETTLQYGELRSICCPWSINKLSNLIFTCFSNIFITRNRDPHRASSINKKWEYEWRNTKNLAALTSKNRKPN